MIKQLSSRAHTDEIIGTVTTAFDVVDKSAYKNEGLSLLNVELGEGNSDLTTAQNRKRKNDETIEVSKAKRARARAFSSFAFTTRGISMRADKALSDSGQLIYEIVKRHWTGFKKLPQSEQTAKVLSFIGEIETPEYKAPLELCALTVNLDELKISNQFFIGKVASRSKIDAANKELEKVAKARKTTKHVFDQLINYLNAIIVVDNSPDLKELCNAIAGIIEKANTTIHARITRNGHNENNGEDDDEDTENDENDDIEDEEIKE